MPYSTLQCPASSLPGWPALLPAWRRNKEESNDVLDKLEKVVVFGGGSFGTAMGVCLARQKKDLQVRAAMLHIELAVRGRGVGRPKWLHGF